MLVGKPKQKETCRYYAIPTGPYGVLCYQILISLNAKYPITIAKDQNYR